MAKKHETIDDRSPTGNERLRRLKILRELTAKALRRGDLDMGVFGAKTPCGTVACALGHAALLPEFEKLGLEHEWFDHEDLFRQQSLRIFAETPTGTRTFVDAGAWFFGIHPGEAFNIFMTNSTLVLQRIDDVVAAYSR
jgi:hypothetical protein